VPPLRLSALALRVMGNPLVLSSEPPESVRGPLPSAAWLPKFNSPAPSVAEAIVCALLRLAVPPEIASEPPPNELAAASLSTPPLRTVPPV